MQETLPSDLVKHNNKTLPRPPQWLSRVFRSVIDRLNNHTH